MDNLSSIFTSNKNTPKKLLDFASKCNSEDALKKKLRGDPKFLFSIIKNMEISRENKPLFIRLFSIIKRPDLTRAERKAVNIINQKFIKEKFYAKPFVEDGDNSDQTILNLKKLHGWDIEELEERLQPGEIEPPHSAYGFIGKNESLLTLLVKDNKTVHQHGFSHKEIADELSQFLEVCGSIFDCNNKHVKYKGTSYRIDVFCSRGCQDNPFDPGYYPGDPNGEGLPTSSYDMKISKLNESGQAVVTVTNVTSMLPSLIRKFGFYEGDTRYRVSPEDLINLFNLNPRKM